MRIGALSQATGVKVETIRFYEAEGVLPAPARTASNYRVYERAHLDRLSFIKRSRDMGFTLDQVRTLLGLADDDSASCEAVDAIAIRHVEAIDRRIADLQALRAELSRRLNRCRGESIADCGIIEALGAAPRPGH